MISRLIDKLTISKDDFISAAATNDTDKIERFIKANKSYFKPQSAGSRQNNHAYVIQALHCAITLKHTKVVKLILNTHSVDVNSRRAQDDSTLLFTAVLHHQPEIVKLLLAQPNIDVNKVSTSNNSLSPLIVSILKGCNDISLMLLAHPDIQVNGIHSSLIEALHRQQTDVTFTLLAKPDIDINTVKFITTSVREIISPLSLATSNSINGNITDKNILKKLCERFNLSINEQNITIDNDKEKSCNNTALMLATTSLTTMNILLDYPGIDVTLVNSNGDNALMFAVKHGALEMIERLLATKKIDINAKNNDGDTALILAVKYGKANVVDYLLKQKNIDNTISNDKGESAATLSKSLLGTGSVKIAYLIKNNKKQINAVAIDAPVSPIEDAGMFKRPMRKKSDQQKQDIVLELKHKA